MLHMCFFVCERGGSMSEFIVYRNKNFASIPTYHMKDKSLSLKAVGLLSKMLLLPEEWDYSLSGLASLNKDGIDSVRSTLKELSVHNYVEIEKVHSEKGTFKYNYRVFEKPEDKLLYLQNKPDREKPHLVEPGLDKPSNNINKKNNINNKYDKFDKLDLKALKEEELKHDSLTEQLIEMNYVDSNDYKSLTSLDNLFSNYRDEGHSTKELSNMILYIVPKVIARDFLDEDGEEITNRVGYLKASLDSNWQKFKSYSEPLYPEIDDSIDDFENQSSNEKSIWDDFEL